MKIIVCSENSLSAVNIPKFSGMSEENYEMSERSSVVQID